MKLEKITEYELSETQAAEIQRLLATCFPEFLANRIYFKQRPQFRFLAWKEKQLVAQVGVEYRVICLGNQPRTIFGVIDLCVLPKFQKQGIGAKMLQELESLAKQNSIDAILLFADDQRLYEKQGFQSANNKCKWLGIDEHKTVGILEDSQADCMMVKTISNQPWLEADVDLLGYLF